MSTFRLLSRSIAAGTLAWAVLGCTATHSSNSSDESEVPQHPMPEMARVEKVVARLDRAVPQGSEFRVMVDELMSAQGQVAAAFRPSPPPVLPIVKLALSPGKAEVTLSLDMYNAEGHFSSRPSDATKQPSHVRLLYGGTLLDTYVLKDGDFRELKKCADRQEDGKPNSCEIKITIMSNKIKGDEKKLRAESSVWFYHQSKKQWETILGALEYVHQ